MNRLLLLGVVCLSLFLGCSGDAVPHESAELDSAVSTSQDRIVEVSCGQCQFGMTGDDCDLAVRIDGESYFVDGSSIDDHGDAHGEDGLCNCVRSAKVSGEIKDGRFVATAIEVLPNSELSD